MSRAFVLALLMVSAGCGTQIGDEGKPASVFTSTGSITVETSGLAFPVLDHWEARLEAVEDFFAATPENENMDYRLLAGASDGDDESLIVRLTAETLAELLAQPVALADADENGDKDRADAETGGTFLSSDQGTFTVTGYEGDQIAAVLDTVLKEFEAPDGEPVVATFEGEIRVGCEFLGELEGGAREVFSVGLDDPSCAALFE